eukprot:GFUD01009655.1.p1 GENE.GFUD01009655.1~~GFUD01009655.1.p1  ORF type:complete len:1191 (+),score=266.73 GFUD01009655.1:76-3573(+)
MASKEAKESCEEKLQKFLTSTADEGNKVLEEEILPMIGLKKTYDKKMFAMSKNENQVEDYADAKLIEEMMDMDIEEYTRLRKQKREEDREQRKKEEQSKDDEKARKQEEENRKGEANKQDKIQDEKIDEDENTESDDDKSEDSEFLENITSEFFQAVKTKMKKGELYKDDMNAAFKRFLFTRVLEKEKEKEKVDCDLFQLEECTNIRDCFGPPDACHNCESKGGSDKQPCARGAECVSACKSESLKRCSGCHLVAYCSEKCQKEHWTNNHQKMCKLLSGKKKIKEYRHQFDSCEICADRMGSSFRDKNNILLPCGIATIQIYLMNHYWLHFGYHREASCQCSPESQRMRIKTMTVPMQPPFVMGEISGQYLGWIDEYLAILGVYLVAIEAKYEDEIESLGIKSNMSQIAMFIIGIRANYWYFVTSEKSRAMTEVQFTQRMHMISTHIVDKDTKHLHEIDTAFKTLNHKNVWWETFLHHMAEFYRRLRSTRYLLFNTENIPKNKKKEFSIFKNLHDNGILNLSRSVEILLPSSPSNKLGDLLPGFLVSLSSGTKCYVCHVDIGGKRAQYQLQVPIDQNIWNVHHSKTLEEIMLIRYPKLPIIFEDMDEKGLVVTCGINTNCNTKALQIQLEYYEMITRANINFAFKSQKCQGCLRYSYESHRCSGCRSVRYCSQDCLVDDWKVHQTLCKEYSENGTLESIGCRKLEGDHKKAYFDQCVYWLGKCDAVVKVILSSWKDKNIGFHQLCESEPPKKKKKKKLESKGANNVEEDENNKENEEIVTEIPDKPEDSHPQKEKTGPRVTIVSSDSFKSKFMSEKLAGLFEHGVKVVVCSLGENGKDINMKPFITEDKDGNKTVHKENIPEKNRIKSVDDDDAKTSDKKQQSESRSSSEKSEGKSDDKKKDSTNGHFKPIKPENLEKVKKIIHQHRSNTMLGKHFEIRHIKNQAWLNDKICQVIDVEPKNQDLFDPRVVCKLKGEDKQFSLKQTNLVDICADIDDLVGTRCVEGHIFRKPDKNLTNSYVSKMLKKIQTWAAETNQVRPDQLHRLAELGRYIAGEVKELCCKDNPDFENDTNMSEDDCFSACLAAVRPGCVGDTLIHFNRFNQLICACDEQLMKRFREFVVTGMCHSCQAWYIERQDEENSDPFGNIFVKCTRVKSLDGLTLRTA